MGHRIFIDVARSLNILHQVNAVGFQCTLNASENVERFDLIMDGVKGSDKIKRFRLGRFIEIAQVTKTTSLSVSIKCV
jgi:hypothetical protein